MSFYGLMSLLQKNDILYMLCVREHIYRADGTDFVFAVQQAQVACLSGRVAAYVNDALRFGKQQCVDHVLMHTGSWRVMITSGCP